MIVEPVPATSRSPRRRLVRAARIVLPVALLAGVVAVAALGERPPELPAATQAPATNGTAADATRRPVAASPPGEPRDAPAYPAQIEGLPVRSVREALAANGSSEPRGLVAVSGMLSMSGAEEACDHAADDPQAIFCPRRTILADVPSRAAGSGSLVGVGPSLHPVVPAGVRLPRELAPGAASDRAGGDMPTVPVVVLARFLDAPPDPCSARGLGCRDTLLLERVAWVDGATWRPATVDPAAGRSPHDESWWRRRAEAQAKLAPDADAAVPLLTAFLRPASLVRLDALAFEAAGRAPEGAIWYVRGYVARDARGGRAGIRWVVVDDLTGEVLARGSR